MGQEEDLTFWDDIQTNAPDAGALAYAKRYWAQHLLLTSLPDSDLLNIFVVVSRKDSRIRPSWHIDDHRKEWVSFPLNQTEKRRLLIVLAAHIPVPCTLRY